MYRVWYSTESFADFIIDNTILKSHVVDKYKLLESDAKTTKFHYMPDHIKKILVLDAPDLIIEKVYETYSEPILSIEISKEAGTGHNVFQRFARIVSAVENKVPSFYIYPKAKIITRDTKIDWDPINPLIFYGLEELMSIFDIPALFYYFSNDYDNSADYKKSSFIGSQGIIYSKNIKYIDCPDETDMEMKNMFAAIDILVNEVEVNGANKACREIIKNKTFKTRRKWMQKQYYDLSDGKDYLDQSPNTSTITVPTEYLINYLRKNKYKKSKYESLLLKRKETVIYMPQTNNFRSDPYAGCLTAIDYMQCRTGNGKTFENREKNLVFSFGKVVKDDKKKSIDVKGSLSVETFCKNVISTEKKNLLNKKYKELKKEQIARYYMQVRYGSTFSKNKSIRIFSTFADAILFKDGALWRDN